MFNFMFYSRYLRISLLSLILISFPFSFLRSQDDLKKYVNIMPPNVSSFEKYGNIPISYNTGQVSEVISLYDFEIDDNVHIPLQLSYNNNGMKPDEVPTWVGHGWDLMPGGYIVQDIRGLDDLSTMGMSVPANKNQTDNFMLGIMPVESRYQFIKNAIEGLVDTQQDVFSLNFLGKSTKFYFDGSQIKFIRFEPYKIVLNSDKNFEVTDEKGYKYIFGLRTGCSGNVTNPTESGPLGGSNTWSLTKIISPYGSEVSLAYGQDAQYITNSSSIVYTTGALGFDASNSACGYGYSGYQVVNSSSMMNQQLLQSISYNGRKIIFNTMGRNDLTTSAGTTAKALSSIQVINENNQVVKNINFTYDNNLRLKLNQVSVLDNVSETAVQQYHFDYYQYLNSDLTSIPLITNSNRTYAIDHWGYYNGAVSNTFKGVPKADYNSFVPYASPITGDNDRSANGLASQIGMLKSITYPTGGYTQLEYEPNKMDFGSVTALPAFFKNQPLDNSMVPIPGADDEVTCPEAEGAQGTKTGTFTLNQDMNVAMAWQFQATPDNSQFCSVTISKTDGGFTPITKFGYTEAGSENLFLAAGTYTYNLDAGCAFAQSGDNNFARFWMLQYQSLPSGTATITIGGNRIHRIKTFDPVANKTSMTRFEYNDPEFYQIPYYISAREMYTTLYDGSHNGNLDCGKQYTIGAYNIIPFEGNTIYYKSVTEYLGENGENGKTVYTYPMQELYSSGYNKDPFPEITNLSWRGSEPQKVEQYKKDGAVYTIQKSTSYTYTDPPNYSSLWQMTNGVKLGIIGVVFFGVDDPANYSKYYAQGQVYLPNDRYDKSSVTSIEYTNSGNSIVNVNKYNYNDNYFLLSKIQQINSKGESVEHNFWYPGDYNSNVSNIATLQANNMIGLPQKNITTNNGNIVSGEVHDFDGYGNITGIYRYENSTLLPMPTHDPSGLYPTGFNLKDNLSYTTNSKVKEFDPLNNIPTAVLWGYNNMYPIAEVKNATYQNLVDVLGQSTIDQLSGNAPGTDNQVRDILNQLRTNMSLKGSLVTTYTYAPLIGMTSQTDVNNRTTYYEYDNLGRLSVVRDKDQNIIKKYCYNYAGQPVNCTTP